MNERFNKVFWLLIAVLVFLIFRPWFGLGEISAGDAGFYFSETLKDFPNFPYLWISDGLGSYISLLYYFPYSILWLKFLALLEWPWILIERIVWYWPFLILGVFSSWFLVKTVLPEGKFRFLAPLIYFFNTYILMIVGGGQASIFLPYALAPLVLGLFINLLKSSRVNELKNLIIAGVVLAAQVSFEPRIAFVTLIGVGIYYLLFIANGIRYISLPTAINGLKSLRVLGSLVFSFALAFLLHFYWILPTIVLRKESYDAIFSSSGWVGFLSFADFSNSFSLLHPNWPENIFGKTYLMRPEFLVLPILAFSSSLFINYSRVNELTSLGARGLSNPLINNSLIKNKIIIYFSILALIGAFLVKGANPPFGEIYFWLFNNIPGMNLFRDASKFYVLVALSYSVLIPFSLEQIAVRVSSIKYKVSGIKILNTCFLILASFLVYWLFLIKPAVLGQLGGTLKIKTVSQDYFQLKDFLNSQDEFFRTFWVPKKQRFGFYSHNHPAISAESFLTDTVCLEPFCSLKVAMPEKWGQKCFPNDRCHVRELSYFLNPRTAEILSQMAVKYVIVPFDSESEIFIAEYQYNHQQREEVEAFLDIIPWLKKIEVAEKIAVYELSSPGDHFFIDLLTSSRVNELKSWKMINPTKYLVSLKIKKPPVGLVFSESYDELWQAKIDEETISSRPYMGILNSFLVNKTGDFEVTVELTGQKYIYWGGVVSLTTLLLSLGGLIYLRPRKPRLIAVDEAGENKLAEGEA